MAERDGTFQDRRAPVETSWHLKREINISLIISVVSIAITMVMGYADIKKEIALIQADVGVLHQQDVRQVEAMHSGLETVSAQYLRLESKLDRLIERQK
jgi:hypothetical protein